MTTEFPFLTGQIAKDGVITPQDILTLRRSVWADGAIDKAEVDAIFTLNDLISSPTPEWTEFFVEALSTWLVDQEHPRGYIDEAQAAWLIERLSRSGVEQSRSAIEMVVHCLEKADSAPDSLAQFALANIVSAVLAKHAGGSPHINARDVQMLRRLIFAPGSQHPGCVGQPEAEMLWRLKDATLGADNVREWQDLFVKGVGNYLQGFAGHEPLSREREAELEDFINRPAAGLGNFFVRMAEASRTTVECELAKVAKPARWFGRRTASKTVPAGAAFSFAANKSLVPDPESAKANVRPLRAGDQSWLDRHIQADNQIDPLERALLDFLKRY